MTSDSIAAVTESVQKGYSSNIYGPFSAGKAVEYNQAKQYTQASSSATGVTLKLPGAQILGYYTSVLPKFPIF